jgi:hypothetical protein
VTVRFPGVFIETAHFPDAFTLEASPDPGFEIKLAGCQVRKRVGFRFRHFPFRAGVFSAREDGVLVYDFQQAGDGVEFNPSAGRASLLGEFPDFAFDIIFGYCTGHSDFLVYFAP